MTQQALGHVWPFRSHVSTSEARQDLAVLADMVEEHGIALREATYARARSVPAIARLLARMTDDELAVQNRHANALQAAALREGDWLAYLEHLQQQGTLYAHMGMGFGDWMQLTQAWLHEVADLSHAHHAEDLTRVRSILRGAHLFTTVAMATIGEAYLAAKEEVILRQEQALTELSSPVLQLEDRLLVMPIIGAIDTHRARQITEGMLGAVRSHRARAVVIDVTGVPIVDSRVAVHLLHAVEAGRLMGAMVIVTGISAEVAMTMVSMGSDLPGVPTAGDLQAGISLARREMQRGRVVAAAANGRTP